MKKENKMQLYAIAIIVVVIAGLLISGKSNSNSTKKPATTSDPSPSVSQTPTSTSISKSDSANTSGKVSDYMTYKDNVVYSFISAGAKSKISPLFNQSIEVIYRKGTTLQRKITVPGSAYEYDEVLQITDTEAKLIYGDNKYSHLNLIDNPPAQDNYTILKAPLKKGATWKVNSNSVSEITNMSANVEVPYGKFVAMEVTTNKSNGDYVKDYYVKGVGLVKTMFSSATQGEQDSVLNSVDNKVKVNTFLLMYSYDANNDKILTPAVIEIPITTNPDYKSILEKILKKTTNKDCIPLLSTNTKINFVKISTDRKSLQLDLSKNYITDMKTGSDVEQQLIKCLVNTVGNFYNVDTISITIDGASTEDGSASFGTPIPVEKPKQN